jgi:hypothetical protein
MDSFSAAKEIHLCGTPLDVAMLRLKHDPVGAIRGPQKDGAFISASTARIF